MADQTAGEDPHIDRRLLMGLLALGAAAPTMAAAQGHTGHQMPAGGHAGHAGHTNHAGHAGHSGATSETDHASHFSLAGPKPKIAMLVYPEMVMLDLIGPLTTLKIAQCELHLVWKSKTPCMTDAGIAVTPTMTFAECPKDVDVLFVPGGIIGTTACMNDPEVLAFLAECGKTAKWVTSVCTGSLILAAAGLLKGYKSTSLWATVPLLAKMGAIPSMDRVVIDRNRMSGGGVTAGIDFGLTLVAQLRGEEMARRVQLFIQYAPQPPFNAGMPEGAGPELTAKVLKARERMDAGAAQAADAAGKRLGIKA